MESEVIEFTAVALLVCSTGVMQNFFGLPGQTCCWASSADAGVQCVFV